MKHENRREGNSKIEENKKNEKKKNNLPMALKSVDWNKLTNGIQPFFEHCRFLNITSFSKTTSSWKHIFLENNQFVKTGKRMILDNI
jgi:hypothetical protein